MNHSYSASHYDDQFCLKPPLLLWLATLYLSRAITLPIAMAIGSFAGVDSQAISLFRGLWTVQGLLPSSMAAVFLYALCRRLPTASATVRKIWARGRPLLAAAAALDIVLTLVEPVQHGQVDDGMLLAVGAAGFDVYFLIYVLASRHVRDAFAEFPAPLAATGRAG